jgi:glycerophosphoryl diester phosphodiesterase
VSLLALVLVGALGYGGAVLPSAFDLQGHRGARGLRPENTLPAFAKALSLGVTTLELDLGLTRDRVLVVGHDPRLSANVARGPDGRFVEGSGPAIYASTYDDLQGYDVGRLRPGSAYAARFPEQVGMDGVRMPRFADVVALAGRAGNRSVRFNVEIKIDLRDPEATAPPAAFADALVAFLREHDLGPRVTIQSFDWRTLLEVSRAAPDIRTACLTIVTPNNDTVTPDASGASPWHAGLSMRENGGSMPALVKAAGCRVWSMFWRNLSADDVARSHAIGVEVLPWTVNDPADMARLIDMGVDGIITDYPDRLRAVMAAKKLPLP